MKAFKFKDTSSKPEIVAIDTPLSLSGLWRKLGVAANPGTDFTLPDLSCVLATALYRHLQTHPLADGLDNHRFLTMSLANARLESGVGTKAVREYIYTKDLNSLDQGKALIALLANPLGVHASFSQAIKDEKASLGNSLLYFEDAAVATPFQYFDSAQDLASKFISLVTAGPGGSSSSLYKTAWTLTGDGITSMPQDLSLELLMRRGYGTAVGSGLLKTSVALGVSSLGYSLATAIVPWTLSSVLPTNPTVPLAPVSFANLLKFSKAGKQHVVSLASGVSPAQLVILKRTDKKSKAVLSLGHSYSERKCYFYGLKMASSGAAADYVEFLLKLHGLLGLRLLDLKLPNFSLGSYELLNLAGYFLGVYDLDKILLGDSKFKGLYSSSNALTSVASYTQGNSLYKGEVMDAGAALEAMLPQNRYPNPRTGGNYELPGTSELLVASLKADVDFDAFENLVSFVTLQLKAAPFVPLAIPGVSQSQASALKKTCKTVSPEIGIYPDPLDNRLFASGRIPKKIKLPLGTARGALPDESPIGFTPDDVLSYDALGSGEDQKISDDTNVIVIDDNKGKANDDLDKKDRRVVLVVYDNAEVFELFKGRVMTVDLPFVELMASVLSSAFSSMGARQAAIVKQSLKANLRGYQAFRSYFNSVREPSWDEPNHEKLKKAFLRHSKAWNELTYVNTYNHKIMKELLRVRAEALGKPDPRYKMFSCCSKAPEDAPDVQTLLRVKNWDNPSYSDRYLVCSFLCIVGTLTISSEEQPSLLSSLIPSGIRVLTALQQELNSRNVNSALVPFLLLNRPDYESDLGDVIMATSNVALKAIDDWFRGATRLSVGDVEDVSLMNGAWNQVGSKAARELGDFWPSSFSDPELDQYFN